MDVTVAQLWVCSKCGMVSHLEGTVQPHNSIHGFCGAATHNHTSTGVPFDQQFKHSLKLTPVVVPYGR